MAKPKLSSDGRKVCVGCGQPKSATEYASTTADTCIDCVNKAAKPVATSGAAIPASVAAKKPVVPRKLRIVDPDPTQVEDENDEHEVFPQVEIDPSNPTDQELAARIVARRNLLQFIKRFRPKYMAGWVHEDICRRLQRFMEQVEQGLEPRLLLMVPVRHGKLLADSTPVRTWNRGWTTHGDLRVGDYVFSPNGLPVKVLALSEPDTANVRITFTNGESLLCHENHEWRVFQRSHRQWLTVETRYWLESNRFGKRRQLKSGGRYLYQLPAVEPLAMPDALLPLHPYAFGAWLGDGSVGKACITHHVDDTQVIAAITALGYPVSTVRDQVSETTKTTYFGSGIPNNRSAFSQGLKDTGALHDKHIPRAYLDASVAQRLELLAGLIDTDGHVDKNSGRVRIVTVSDTLRDDIMELVRSLGQQCSCHTQQPNTSSSGIVGRRPTYYISFTPTLHIPTRIPRKAIAGNPREAVAISSVERVARGERGRCIQVEGGLYLAGERLVPTHNSEISSRHFPAFVLGHHPDWEIIAASGASSLAMSFSRYLRDLIRDPSYRALFPDTQLDSASQSVENWGTTHGGGYLAAGIGTMITGRGAHILIIDDPVKDAEAADSPTIRDNVWEWYMSTAYTRLAPGGGVLGIMTWWNEDDWAGRIQQVMATGDGDVFEIVKYPAINDIGDEYILADDSIVQIPPGSPVPEGARLTRPHNSALHPERYSYESLMKRKANYYALGQQRWWAALYQQNPTPEEGAFFTKDMFKTYVNDPHPSERAVYQAWDFAITEKSQSDYTVGSTGYLDVNDNLYVTEVLRFRSDDAFVLADAILDMWEKHGSCAIIGVEDGQIWKSIESVFLRRCEERRLYPSYEVLKPFTDKFVRAQPLRGRMQVGKVWFKTAAWFDDLRNEFLRFGSGGKNDDQVDSVSWLTRLVLLHRAPRAAQEKKPKSWKDRLPSILAGLEDTGHMAA